MMFQRNRLVVAHYRLFESKIIKTMGVLKLSVIEKQNKRFKMKIASKNGKRYQVSNCSCPCWAFLKDGEVVMDDIRSTASWNID